MSKKIKVTVSTGWANGDHVDYYDLPKHWDSLNDEEKEELLLDYAVGRMNEVCSAYGEIVED